MQLNSKKLVFVTVPSGRRARREGSRGMNENFLKGRHVVITGGARGIGLAMAFACKRSGAAVTVLARSQKDLDEVQEQLSVVEPSIGVRALRADVTLEDSLGSTLKQATKELGPIYGLICAAGIYGAIGEFARLEF